MKVVAGHARCRQIRQASINTLLNRVGIEAKPINSFEELRKSASSMFVAIFEAMFQVRLQISSYMFVPTTLLGIQNCVWVRSRSYRRRPPGSLIDRPACKRHWANVTRRRRCYPQLQHLLLEHL